VEKPLFSKSYPHYPQKTCVFGGLLLSKERTNVLVRNDENSNLSKKEDNFIDIGVFKI